MLDSGCANACALNGLPGPMRHWFTGFTHSLTHCSAPKQAVEETTASNYRSRCLIEQSYVLQTVGLNIVDTKILEIGWRCCRPTVVGVSSRLLPALSGNFSYILCYLTTICSQFIHLFICI